MKNKLALMLTAVLTSGIMFTGSGQHVHITGVHMLSSSSHSTLLQTSMKKEKGKYTRKAKELFGGLLDHLERH
ncbi:hypothetical protein [Paenibacillus tianjinensis]|uniref:Uncharacterized protein n=1 Tax=Paenibacillus tianjinensis TaxID=2810347 RepID=A0ABX7L9Q0_9BACL|nr:hypothetical protein [Paenibacillus tianjinensis]QSF42767.1 hypothetical protein JRJ22_15765 [Paenibacillus tianjinensis]